MNHLETIRLILPLPPAPNEWPSHHMELHAAKRRYQRQAWVAACSQVRPRRRPPGKVALKATLYVHQLRDEDNAAGSLKWPLDALRRKQAGSLRWRQGVADLCGYFEDDDPGRLELQEVNQVVDRNNQRLELDIEPVDGEGM